MPPTPAIPTENNAADTLLHDLNRGRVMNELNETFTQLVQEVREHGKAGLLTIKLKIAPASGSDASRVSVTAAIEVKAPSKTPFAGIYYTTEAGVLQKNDPDQAELTFRTLPGNEEPARAIAATATQQPA